MSVLAVSARHQLRLMARDNRLRWLVAAVLLLALASLATGAARLHAQGLERQAAARQDQAIWDALGPINPHGAAHAGRTVYAPISPLAAFDPGLGDYLGSSVKLEGHSQNPSRDRPMEGGAAISRFGGFSAAWALQVVGPLLIVLAGFTAFSGEQARERLKQELGAGASARGLVMGRLAGLSVAALALLAAFTGIGALALLAGGASWSEGLALLAMSAGYGLYLLTFAALTIGVSALLSSARGALVTLLAFWAVATLLVPRIAPALAETLHPTPSAPAFEAAVTDEAKNGASGHDPADERLAALKAQTLKTHGVDKVEDLPFNFDGVALEFGEKNSTETYDRHYDVLFGAYRRQDAMQQAFSLVSPTMAAAPWSRAFAGSDFAAHRLFLSQAETYRYDLIQALNRDVRLHKPKTADPYKADVSAIAAELTFAPQRPSPAQAWAAQRSNLLILAAWALAALGFALFAATRLERAP